MKYLDEMFAFVITEKDIFYAFQNSDYKFRDHCEALEYLYNEKINKGFFKKKIHSREKKLYTMIIKNSNNILFLNETKGGDVYRAFLYIPEYISESQYNNLKYYSDALSKFELIIVYDNNKQDIVNNHFDIDKYCKINNNVKKRIK